MVQGPVTPHYRGLLREDGGREVFGHDTDAFYLLRHPKFPPTASTLQSFEWGTVNNRTLLLAEAILNDLFGGFRLDMTRAFTEEVLSKVPADHLHLTKSTIARWVVRWLQRES